MLLKPLIVAASYSDSLCFFLVSNNREISSSLISMNRGGAGGRDCLGCLCGGGSYGNPNYSFTQAYNFTSEGALTLKTRRSGERSCTIPAQGGTVIFEARGNNGTITLIREEIRRQVRLRTDPNPIRNEIDQEALEDDWYFLLVIRKFKKTVVINFLVFCSFFDPGG